MIRHNPRGRGHRYRASLDQRFPYRPEAGESVTLSVLAEPAIAAVLAEVETDGVSSVHPLSRLDSLDSARTLEDPEGHLAAAAEAGESTDGLEPWSVLVGPFPAGAAVRYRFRSADARTMTPWFGMPVSQWTDDGGLLEVDGDARGRLIDGSVHWLGSAEGVHRVRFSLRLEPEEHVVGLGERFHSIDQRGWSVDAEVFEQYTSQGVRTYLPVPFAHVLGADGWGFHVDTTHRAWFDVAASDPDRITVEVAVDADDPRLGLHLWAGEPAEVLDRLFDVVGRPGAVPDWAFRPWGSSNEWNTQERVEAEAARSVEEGVALGVIVIEAWSDESTIHVWRDARYTPRDDGGPLRLADFEFPADGAWPDPKGMIERLHALGIRVVLWQIPVVPDHDVDDAQLVADRLALVDRGFAVLEEDGSPYRNRGWWFPRALLPDFTQSAAREWWTDKRRYLVEDLGVDGFKTDGGEHAWGDELRFGDGSRGSASNNRYPNLYARAFHELFERLGAEGMTFSRAGHAGAGSFPGHWAGDERSTWEAFRASITAGITAGASGVFLWSWDHAGFSGPLPTAELYLRTGAMAVFSPIMQYHAEFNGHRLPSRDRTPWNVAEQTGDPAVLTGYRRLTALRERLTPYLIEQASRGASESRPLMRGLFFDWPRDPQVWRFPYQYLLGDDLLVAPVVEEGANRATTYLPEGEWVDVWTGEPVPGGQVVTTPAPIDVIPVFCRVAAWPGLSGVFAEG